MKWLLRILGGLVGLVVLLLLFVLATLRPNPPEEIFALQSVQGEPQHVLLFGATGKLGLELAEDLAARGDKVMAFVRPFDVPAELVDIVAKNLDADEAILDALGEDVSWLVAKTRKRNLLQSMGVNLVIGDAMQPDTVAAAFAGGRYDSVITAISGMRANPPPDYIANANIFDAAKAANVSRVIFVSTVGAGDSYAAAPLLSRLALASVIPLKTQAEEHLKEAGLDYTIVRPGGLPPASARGGGVLSEDPMVMGFIVRADLARLIVGILHDDRTIGKTLAAIDPSISSPLAAILEDR